MHCVVHAQQDVQTHREESAQAFLTFLIFLASARQGTGRTAEGNKEKAGTGTDNTAEASVKPSEVEGKDRGKGTVEDIEWGIEEGSKQIPQ